MSDYRCDLPPLLVFRGDEVDALYNPQQLPTAFLSLVRYSSNNE